MPKQWPVERDWTDAELELENRQILAELEAEDAAAAAEAAAAGDDYQPDLDPYQGESAWGYEPERRYGDRTRGRSA